MSEKRRRESWYNDNDDDDEDSVRDSLDLDRETEERLQRESAILQAEWNQRVSLVYQTMESMRNPAVVRAMQMILNLGLVSPTNEFMHLLQMGIRDVEEKERQEEERRQRSQRRFVGEERGDYSPPSPRYEPPSPASHSRNESEVVRDLDAMVLRSQEDIAAGRSSFAFGSLNSDNGNAGGLADADNVDEDNEEQKREQARLLAMYQAPLSNSAPSFHSGDRGIVDLTGDADDENKDDNNRQSAQIFSLYQPPQHPTILQRVEEFKAREEKKAAEPSPLSQVNVSSGLFGPSSSSSSSAVVHPLYQDLIDSDRSIADRIRAHFGQNEDRAGEEEEKGAEEVEYHHQHNDFEWEEVVPPPPDDEDEDSDSSSSSSDDEDNA